MLDYVLNHLPIGFHELEWCVAAEHNEKYPDKDQTGTKIWRKCSQLHKVKKPTCDPNCPPEVRYAKQVFRKIEARGADASGEVDSTVLGIDIDDDFMAISEDNGDKDEPRQETSTNKAATSKESNGGNSAAATVNYAGFTADARFPQPMMVSPQI